MNSIKREREIQEAADKHSNELPKQDAIRLLALINFYAGAKWADRHYAKKLSEPQDAWLARDKSGELIVHAEKPERGNCGEEWDSNKGMITLDDTLFPSVTWENSPKKVKVTIELEEE